MKTLVSPLSAVNRMSIKFKKNGLIVTIIFILAGTISLYAQPNQTSIFSTRVTESKELKELFNSVRQSQEETDALPNMYDFKSKAKKGLGFMSPGSKVINLRYEKITEWSESTSRLFYAYLLDLHKDEMDRMVPGSIEAVITDFENKQCKAGILVWEIGNNEESRLINSIVIFDENWNVLFDSELINFIVGVSEGDESLNETGENTSDMSGSLNNQKSSVIARNYWVHGTFGSLNHYNQVDGTAIVPPYITAATNDADFNFYTDQIYIIRRLIDPLAPPTDPCLYFGSGGQIANLYSNAVPFESSVNLYQLRDDKFNDGTYQVSGSSGHSWSFEFDFSVSAGPFGLGITPVSNAERFTLTSPGFSEVNLNNYVYYYLPGNTYRALFYNGGSLNMNDFNLLTGDSYGEIGYVDVALPMQVAYWSYAVLYPISFTGKTLNISNVEYIRGDHIYQPTYTLTSSNYNIQNNQIDTITAKIKNNSYYVDLEGGSVSMDVSSLGDKLTLLSPATLQIGNIGTRVTKEFKFIVRGNSNGIVTPQVNISSLGWGYPVPPDVIINNIVSIDENIEVGPTIKTLSLNMFIQGFFNTSTNLMEPDTVNVYVRSNTSPFAIIDSAKTNITSDGDGIFTFANADNGTPYFIEVRHRNSIETWSKTPQQFTASSLTYNLSQSETTAYGDNLAEVKPAPDAIYAIYGGDENQNGIVDLSDIVNVSNAAGSFTTGYVSSDMNGDNIVDLSDLVLTSNNANAFVAAVIP